MTNNKEQNLIHSVSRIRKGINVKTLESVIILSVEIAREGREGRKIGTMFVVSDSDTVLKNSKPLILDPLLLHPDAKKHLDNPDIRETVKELAQLDGAFVISDEGVAISACRYINASSRGINLPMGLGSRHMAAASITKRTKAIAVVVSESSMVRIFDDGEIVTEILPELWLLSRHGVHIDAPFHTQKAQSMTIASKNE
jgi:DNA integrity scanning protein DisA with diadenylate cyclase activity